MKTRHPFTASGDADTPSKRITNPLEHSGGQDNSQGLLRRNQTMCLISGCYYQNPVEFNDFNNFHNSHNRVQDWIKNTR